MEDVDSQSHATRLEKLRAELPLLADLHRRFVKDSAANFFQRFPLFYNRSEVTHRFYQQIERDLTFVPKADWDAFAAKIGEFSNKRNKRKHRDWDQLFDHFNEAIGARILTEEYHCDSVHLISRSEGNTCDWSGSASGQKHYIEVKTLNHSDEERQSWYGKAKLRHTCFVPPALITKAREQYDKAKRQLDATAQGELAVKRVLFVVNVDHNFDPIDRSVREMILEKFEEFEDPNYFMHLVINTINDDFE